MNSFDRLSPEAKRVVQTVEAERAQAIAAGQTGDWWVRTFESLIVASFSFTSQSAREKNTDIINREGKTGKV